MNEQEKLERAERAKRWAELRAPLGPVWYARIRIVDGNCVEWTGGKSSKGYGQVWIDGRQVQAHRAFYELFFGSIPTDMTIDHLCRNRLCVSIDHLEIVSLRENILRSDSPSAKNFKKTHCERGHEFTKENTLITGRASGTPHRQCRTCNRERAAQRYREAHPEVKRHRRSLNNDDGVPVRTHCRRGHEMTVENTYYFNSHENGAIYSMCRECRHQNDLNAKARRQKSKIDLK